MDLLRVAWVISWVVEVKVILTVQAGMGVIHLVASFSMAIRNSMNDFTQI